MFLFLSHLTSSVVFGIDFGSESIKLATALPNHGITVSLYSHSIRHFPSYFSIWNSTSPASPITTRLTLSQLSDFQYSFFESSKYRSTSLPPSNNTIKGLSPMLSLTNGLTGREIFALLIRHLIFTADDGLWTPENAQLVIAVDPFLPRPERIAIAEAARLTNSTLIAIVDSPTASAQSFLLENLEIFSEVQKYVLFVNIGARASWAAVFDFRIGGHGGTTPIGTELSLVWNSSLGGDLIDETIARYIGEKLGIERSRHLLNEAKRGKEILSSHVSADLDFRPSFALNRETFCELLAEFNESLKEMVQKALSEANVSRENVDVRLLGSGTRGPFVKEICGGSRMKDSDEYVAIGAAYIAASQNSAFLVRPNRIVAFTNTVVKATIGDQEKELFGAKSRLHENSNITFLAEESAEVGLFVDGTEMSAFTPQLPFDTADECEIAVKFAFGRFTIPSAVGLFVDDVRVAPRFQVRRPAWELTVEGFKESWRMVMTIEEIERARRTFEKDYSDFETRVREGIESLETDSVLKKVVSEAEKKRIRDVLKKQRLALETGKVVNLSESREIVESALSAVERRAAEFVGRPIAWRRFDDAIESFKQTIQSPADRGKYEAASSWAENAKQNQSRRSETDEPAVTVAEIDRMTGFFVRSVIHVTANSNGRYDLVLVPEIEDLPLTDELEPDF